MIVTQIDQSVLDLKYIPIINSDGFIRFEKNKKVCQNLWWFCVGTLAIDVSKVEILETSNIIFKRFNIRKPWSDFVFLIDKKKLSN